jgi:hypothetical protein
LAETSSARKEVIKEINMTIMVFGILCRLLHLKELKEDEVNFRWSFLFLKIIFGSLEIQENDDGLTLA